MLNSNQRLREFDISLINMRLVVRMVQDSDTFERLEVRSHMDKNPVEKRKLRQDIECKFSILRGPSRSNENIRGWQPSKFM